MGKITDLLDAINVDDENTEELYGIFRLIEDYHLPVVRFFLYPGSSLIRQRINLPGKEFTKVSDLGYPPAYCIKGYERASVPYQPMFYACSFPGDDQSDNIPPPRVVALMETSSFYKDKPACGIERCTVSRWDVVKDLELVALPFLAEYSMASKAILEIQELWRRVLMDTTVDPDGLELIEYMAKEIGKEFKSNVGYFKIANFVNYLLSINEKTKKVDGILYPSVPAAGAGFNVALRPSASDEKVQFIGASLCHLFKRGEKAYLRVMNHTVSVQSGEILYEMMPVDPQEELLCQQYYGLSLIN